MTISNARIVTPEGVAKGSVRFDRRILDVGHIAAVPETVIDAGECLLLPGLIELHIHGCFGFDATDAQCAEMAERLPSLGVTAFLPTVVTTTPDKLAQAARAVERAMEKCSGAAVLGLHAEGPFLNPARKGAHEEALLREPDSSLYEPIASVLRRVTAAPELAGSGKLIDWCVAHGISYSIGHSQATYEQCRRAAELGASSFTHTYNAMPPLGHREPGVVGAAMDLGLYAELICDNIHVLPPAQRVLYRANNKLVLVTDAISAAGQPDGPFMLGNLRCESRDGRATLPDGTLAGSVLTLPRALRNIMQNTGAGWAEAAQMVSTRPAELLGLQTKGRIAAGMDADLVLLSENGEVLLTIIGGEIAYSRMP